jgi:hypothetical protein
MKQDIASDAITSLSLAYEINACCSLVIIGPVNNCIGFLVGFGAGHVEGSYIEILWSLDLPSAGQVETSYWPEGLSRSF